MKEYTWIGSTAYRTWCRNERCIEVEPARFEDVLCWRVRWFMQNGDVQILIFNRDHNFDSVKTEIEQTIFLDELRNRDAG